MGRRDHVVEDINPAFSEEVNDSLDRMPPPFCWTTSSNTSIGYFLCMDEDDRFQSIQYFKGEWLFRFKVPPFQRQFKWTEEQCVKFIESVWMGFGLGSYLVNKVPRHVRLIRDRGTPDEGKEYIHEYDDFLIDGLQRITAIKRYLDGEFPVFGFYWRELTRRERRRFESVTFTQCVVSTEDLDKLKELYNRLNFGGTAHTEEERAI